MNLQTHYSRLLQEQKRSGISVQEFCRRKHISSWTFYNWRKRLNGIHSSPKNSVSNKFVEVDVDTRERNATPPMLEIEIGTALLRVPPEFPANNLIGLVCALQKGEA